MSIVLKNLCFRSSKLITILSNVSPFTLCTVQAHASVIGNCIHCISCDDGPLGLVLNLARIGSMGSNLFSSAKVLLHFSIIKVLPAKLSSDLMYVIEGCFLPLFTLTRVVKV